MTTIYKTGEFELRADERRLLKHGEPVALGARTFDLLLALIEHRDRVLGKDELMALVWHDLVVEESNLTVQISALRKVLGAHSVATVPGRGYRFSLELQATASPRDRRGTVARAELTLPDKPSVAVLPFLNLSEDPDQVHFVDGMTEDITTELSRFRDLFVIARNTAFTYKDRAVDVRTVSRELGVRYVVEGSVRHVGQRVRVSVQLINAQSGEHIWAEIYDHVLQDIFDLQAEVTHAIVAAMAPQIHAAEDARSRRTPPDDLNAHALAQHGWALAVADGMAYDCASRDEAFRWASKALALDANCGLALRTQALVQWRHAYHNTTPSMSGTLSLGLAASARAIALDPGDHHARRCRGLLLAMAQQPDESLAELRRAHEINPNCALTLSWLGLYEAMHGDASKGVPYAQEGLRLSPRDPALGTFLVILGFSHFTARDYAAATQVAQAALREASSSAVPHVLAAISWVGTSQIEPAHSAFKTLQHIAPQLVEARLAGQWPSSNTSYVKRAHTFLRIAAGLENPASADTLR
ncbi:MAG: winged helix-turn-helix domain-containing protein [Burkholderiales bacterium]|nr:winged helix-turn-helix domain-containing protein [Burkholderiales bacterium]